MRSFVTYLKNVSAEMKHVVFPSRTQGILHTILIVLISAFVAVYVGGLDYVFTGVVNRILSGS